MIAKAIRHVEHPSLKDRLATTGTLTAALVALTDVALVGCALPYIAGGLAVSMTEAGWVSTGYWAVAVAAATVAIWRRASAARPAFVGAATGMFVLFSLACAFADSLTALVLFRAGQGLAAGALVPPTARIVLARRRPLAIIISTLTAIMSFILAPVVSGWITDEMSWHHIFLLEALVGAMALAPQLYAFTLRQPDMAAQF